MVEKDRKRAFLPSRGERFDYDFYQVHLAGYIPKTGEQRGNEAWPGCGSKNGTLGRKKEDKRHGRKRTRTRYKRQGEAV